MARLTALVFMQRLTTGQGQVRKETGVSIRDTDVQGRYNHVRVIALSWRMLHRVQYGTPCHREETFRMYTQSLTL